MDSPVRLLSLSFFFCFGFYSGLDRKTIYLLLLPLYTKLFVAAQSSHTFKDCLISYIEHWSTRLSAARYHLLNSNSCTSYAILVITGALFPRIQFCILWTLFYSVFNFGKWGIHRIQFCKLRDLYLLHIHLSSLRDFYLLLIQFW